MNRPHMAAQFAPVLYFHPMEQYGLTDPAHYFTEAVVYDSNHKPNPQAISSPLSYLSILGNSEQDAIIKGAPLDANGISTSRVFFNAYPLPGQSNAWVYNYHLYYAWNGCSNMALSTPSQRGWQSTLEFVACPYSVHEADWERVSIVVCPEDPQPDPTVEQQRGSESNAPPSAEKGRVRAAVLSQHNHDELIHCMGANSCKFENGHLLVYLGLNSHANFAHASNGTIFGGIRNDQKHSATSGSSSSGGSDYGSKGDDGEMDKMEGVVMLDRTAKGAKWVPSLANLAPLPRQQSQDGGQSSARQKGRKAAWGLLGSKPVGKRKGDGGKDEVIEGALAADEDAWAFYPGFWGTWAWRMPPSVTCFRPGLLQPASCPPDSPAWHLLARTLGLPVHQEAPPLSAKPVLALPAEGTAPPVTESYHAKGGAKQGPNYRHWTGKWQPPKPTKLWHLPAHSLTSRLFANGNERLPVLRCLPGMGNVGGGVSKHVQTMGVLGVGRGHSGQGLVTEGASLPSELSETEALRGLSLMPQALKWACAIEPFLCLAAIPAMLLVIVPWMLQVLQFTRLVNEAEESGAVLRSGAYSSHRDARGPPHFMQRTGNGGGGGGGSDGGMCSNGDGLGLTPKGHQSGGEQIQNTGHDSIAPLLGLVSLACGLCVVYGAQFYFSLMKASVPSACPLVDALRLFVSILVSILVVLDIGCALRGLRGVISLLKSGKTGGSFRDGAWAGCWCVFQTCCKWWRVARGPLQQYTTYMLLGVVAFCVVAQASVQAANVLLSLLLPLHSASPSLGHIEFLAGQTSAPVLAIVLFLRSLFDRWQLEARATLLVLPCFFFVVRHRCWPIA